MRKITTLTEGWRFLKNAVSAQEAYTAAARGETVTLPHTWNAVDGQDGGNDYHRGICWYVRELAKDEIAGDRLFLELNGAAHTCEVYLNGEKLCRHEGGYSTFTVPIDNIPSTMQVIADTTAMSVPHEVEYTLHFEMDE